MIGCRWRPQLNFCSFIASQERYCARLAVRVAQIPQKGLGVLATHPLAARTTVAFYLIKAFDASSHEKSEYSIKPMQSTRLVFGEGKIGDVFGGSLLPPGRTSLVPSDVALHVIPLQLPVVIRAPPPSNQ